MLQEETNHGMADVEGRLSQNMEEMKAELHVECDARQLFDERVHKLEGP